MSRADNQAVSDGCTPRIAIFPLRYSVHAKPIGAAREASYEASPLPLELGFPALKRGQYGLKSLQEGFVYVLDETRGDEFAWKVDEKTGQFVEMDKRSAVLESALKFHKVGQTLPHIWARAGSRVHIVLSDTLLTKAKLRALRMNTNGIRDKIALTVDMKAWTAESPIKNTFAAEHMSMCVADVQHDAQAPAATRQGTRKLNAGRVAQQMQAFSPCKQLAVVPPNPIALVQDLTALVMEAEGEVHRYVTDVEKGDAPHPERSMRYRKNMVAKVIDEVYLSAYANHYGMDPINDRASLELQIAADTRSWHARQQNLRVYPKVRYVTPPANPLSPRATRAAVVAERAKRHARHVMEGTRLEFQDRYDKELATLHAAVVDSKNDRCLWLRTYLEPIGPADLGAQFQSYDMAEPHSSTARALAFCRCVEGMIVGPTTPIDEKRDQEHALFKEWWKMPWARSPLTQNMAADKGFGDVLGENKSDVAADLLLSRGLTPMAHRAAARMLMVQVGVYVLSRFHNDTPSRNYKGAARDTIDAHVHRLAGTGTEDDARLLLQNLDPAGRYAGHTSMGTLNLAEAEQQLHQLAGRPPLTATGSMARGAGDAIRIIDTRDVSPGLRAASPLLARLDVGVSALVLLLSAVNLRNAMANFSGGESWQDRATQANLAAAFAGVGSGLAGLAVATRALGPATFERVGMLTRPLRILSSTWTIRIFGYGGAIFDAVTNWFKASAQYKVGNRAAGDYYTAAGFAMGLGGAAMTTAAAAATAAITSGGVSLLASFGAVSAGVPVWGWIVAGVVFLGLGLWWIFQAEKSHFTRPEYWLNDCIFGRQELMGRERTVSSASWAQDNESLLNAFQGPQMADWEWRVVEVQGGSDLVPRTAAVYITYRPRLVLTVAYPLPGTEHRVRVEATGNAQLPVAPHIEPIGDLTPLPSGGSLVTYQVTKMANSVSYSVRVDYTPDGVGRNLEAHVTIGQTPRYYSEGALRASADPTRVPPAPWEQPEVMFA